MKLRNKKTGEIVDTSSKTLLVNSDGRRFIVLDKVYDSLAELNEEWEDYEEPHETCRLTSYGEVVRFSSEDISNAQKRECVNIGNYFGTREEAEKAVEKLKAWKRLKDKGFRFDCWYGGSKSILFSIPQEIIDTPTAKDLDLLFGGEEC